MESLAKKMHFASSCAPIVIYDDMIVPIQVGYSFTISIFFFALRPTTLYMLGIPLSHFIFQRFSVIIVVRTYPKPYRLPLYCV